MKKIFQKHPVKFAYQFGSSITGHQRPDSDIDIAVYLDENLSPFERFDIRLQLTTELGRYFKRDADVIVLNDIKSLFFKHVILYEGKPIFIADPLARADFVCRQMSLYFDYEPFLDAYNRAYVQWNK